MIYDSPKSTEKIVWGIKHALSPLPKFAKRLGAALTAVAGVGLVMNFATPDFAPMFTKVMMWAGAVGALLTSFFGKVQE